MSITELNDKYRELSYGIDPMSFEDYKEELVKLLENGCDPNKPDDNGDTILLEEPLYNIISDGDKKWLECLEILVKYGFELYDVIIHDRDYGDHTLGSTCYSEDIYATHLFDWLLEHDYCFDLNEMKWHRIDKTDKMYIVKRFIEEGYDFNEHKYELSFIEYLMNRDTDEIEEIVEYIIDHIDIILTHTYSHFMEITVSYFEKDSNVNDPLKSVTYKLIKILIDQYTLDVVLDKTNYYPKCKEEHVMGRYLNNIPKTKKSAVPK